MDDECLHVLADALGGKTRRDNLNILHNPITHNALSVIVRIMQSTQVKKFGMMATVTLLSNTSATLQYFADLHKNTTILDVWGICLDVLRHHLSNTVEHGKYFRAQQDLGQCRFAFGAIGAVAAATP